MALKSKNSELEAYGYACIFTLYKYTVGRGGKKIG
jgi:hypothetical protein